MFCVLIGSSRPSLKDLHNHVVPNVAHKWKDLGVQLLQPDQEYILNIIERDSDDAAGRCKCVLEKWLKTATVATWDRLIEALRSPGVQLDYIANQIEQKLTTQGKKYYYRKFSKNSAY